MDRVFISYSRRNQTFAERLARDLTDAGLDVWFDLRQIHGGEFWEQEIFRGLERAEFLIVCLSPPAVASQWVQKEVLTVRDAGKPIFPIMVQDAFQDVQNSDALKWLLDIQFIKFEGRYEEAFPELLESLPGGRALGTFDVFDTENIPNPFKGLEAFQQRDAALFFGREEMVQRAVRRLRRTRFLALVGASGSGKSSVVRAGVIPSLREGSLPGYDKNPICIFTPGDNPIAALAERLHPLLNTDDSLNERSAEAIAADLRVSGRIVQVTEDVLAQRPNANRLLLVIDQFEELFTRAPDSERRPFVDLLHMAATVEGSRAQVIATMRADFFGNLSHYPDLAALFERDNLIIVTEMTTANLLRAIEGPAKAVGLRYEQGLVDRILDDVRSEPGSLPLLQYALRELYKRREGAQLTMAAYNEIGGVQQALAQHAESIYDQQDPQMQDIIQRILLRLVEVGESGEATRRKVARGELTFRDVPEEQVAAAIDLLTAPESRLLVASREIRADEEQPEIWLQVSHEALIRQWTRFQTWVTASLEDLQYESDLRKVTADWLSNDRDPAYLLRGRRLTRAELWLEKGSATPDQRALIEASMQAQTERERAEQERLQRELDLQTRAVRRARLAGGIFAVLFVGALVAVGVFMFLADQLNTTLTDLQIQEVRTRSLANATTAQRVLLDGDGDLALALAVEANTSPTLDTPPPQAQFALAEVAFAPGTRKRIVLPPEVDDITAMTYANNGQTLIAGTRSGAVLVYATDDLDAEPQVFTDQNRRVVAVTANPDGRFLATVTDDDNLHLRDRENNAVVDLTYDPISIGSALFLPDGRLLLGASDGLRLANAEALVTGDDLEAAQLIPGTGPSQRMAYSTLAADETGGTLAGGTEDNRVFVVRNGATWGSFEFADNVTALSLRADGGRLLVGLSSGALWSVNLSVASAGQAVVNELPSAETSVRGVGFIPGTRTYTVISNDNSLRVWNFDTQRVVAEYDIESDFQSLAVRADGSKIATSAENNTLRVWDIQAADIAQTFNAAADDTPDTLPLLSVAINPAGSLIVGGTQDGQVVFWNSSAPDSPTVRQTNLLLFNIAIAVEAPTLAAAGGSTAVVYNLTRYEQRGRAELPVGVRVVDVALSPDGQQLAIAANDDNVYLWDLTETDDAGLFSLDDVLNGHTDIVTSVVYSADGTRLLSGSHDTTLRLWDLNTGSSQTFEGHTSIVTAVALDADQGLAASGSRDETVRLWDITTGRELQQYDDFGGIITGVYIAPETGNPLVSANDGSVRLIDRETGLELRRYDFFLSTGSGMKLDGLAASAEVEMAAVLGADDTIRLLQVMPDLDDLLTWTNDNRFIKDLTCSDRLQFRIGVADADATFGQRRFVSLSDDETEIALLNAPQSDASSGPTLQNGAPLRLMGESEAGFERVCTTNGVEGWLPAANLEGN